MGHYDYHQHHCEGCGRQAVSCPTDHVCRLPATAGFCFSCRQPAVRALLASAWQPGQNPADFLPPDLARILGAEA